MATKKEELKEGYIYDYITGTQVQATPEELNAVQVFSKILVEDYNYTKDCIRTRPQYRVKARPSDTKKEYPVDIAVFSDNSRNDDNIYIIVECKKPEVIHPYLLLTLFSSPIVKRQIYAKRFTQDIIDILGERIYELVLPIPKDQMLKDKIIADIETVVNLKSQAKQISRQAMLDVAPTTMNTEGAFMTLISD